MHARSLYLVIGLLLMIISFTGLQLLQQPQSVVIDTGDVGYEQRDGVSNVSSEISDDGHYYEHDVLHDAYGNHVESEEVSSNESGVGLAYGNAVITTDGRYRYISSNGIPEHETGQFPNPGNPNSISEQEISYRVPLNPVYAGNEVFARVPGVALNGIPMEPGTAEREGDYNIEALQETYNLGLDVNNAHVQPTGLYHYHGVPELFLKSIQPDEKGLRMVGYAADGFPMYYDASRQYVSGYSLKESREDGSKPDGTYTQDFEYVGKPIADEIAGACESDESCAELVVLDTCNGAWVDADTYGYFLTYEFPYIPRCLNGVPDESFTKGLAGSDSPQPSAVLPTQGGQGNPPAEAITACSGKTTGSSCVVSTPQGQHSGRCMIPPGLSQLACVPN